MSLFFVHLQSEQAAVDNLLDRLKKLKDEAEEYSEEEGKRRFETIESQTAECEYWYSIVMILKFTRLILIPWVGGHGLKYLIFCASDVNSLI